MKRWLAALVIAAAAWSATAGAQPAETIPPRLTDAEFWRLVSELSEPNGSFRSDNLLSNEVFYERALNQLTRRTKPGRAYLGVGPEQNFTYIAALKPSMAFV